MDLGFTVSAWRRGALGLAVVCFASGLLVLVESRKAPPVGTVTPVLPRTLRSCVLRMESSFPVEAWSVSAAGQKIAPGFSDAAVWEGAVCAPSGTELLLEATSTGDTTRRCALRVVLDGDPQGERSAWGLGGVITTMRIP